jgi:hypothetical protein
MDRSPIFPGRYLQMMKSFFLPKNFVDPRAWFGGQNPVLISPDLNGSAIGRGQGHTWSLAHHFF